MRLAYVVGTRPNFVKMAPVLRALRRRLPDAEHVLIHTGQHYDRELSEVFFDELGMPGPDHVLGVGSGGHSEQVARTLDGVGALLAGSRFDALVVGGDVNSTLGAALAAAQARVPLAHVESGLRSYDRSMPEELNRALTDRLSDVLFVHSASAEDNLVREGVAPDRIVFAGNTMIDTLVAMDARIRAADAPARLGLPAGDFLLVTLHRPALVDGPPLDAVMAELERLDMPVVFPVHPRTRRRLAAAAPVGVRLLDPLGYVDFLSLQVGSAAVLTDSGGVQEETTFLGIPCFTLRANTERPVTLEHGTNTVLGLDPGSIAGIPAMLAARDGARPGPPARWDGRASDRVAGELAARLEGRKPPGA